MPRHIHTIQKSPQFKTSKPLFSPVWVMVNSMLRSTHPEVFLKGVLRNFAKITGKHLCQGLFF